MRKKCGNVLVAQSCPTLCAPMDCSLLGSSVHGIFRLEFWSGLPFPTPGDLADPGIEPEYHLFPASQADSLPTEPSGKPTATDTALVKRKWYLQEKNPRNHHTSSVSQTGKDKYHMILLMWN